MSEKSRRRQFTVGFKRRIVKEADASKAPGEVGALLRREGLHSSHLSAWRAARGRGELAHAKRRGPKAVAPDHRDARIAELERQIKRVTKSAGTLSPRKILKDGGVDFLLFGLNTNLKVSIPANGDPGQEESCIPMGELVQEMKAQIDFVDRRGADALSNYWVRWSSLPLRVSIPEPDKKPRQEESCTPGELMQDLKPEFGYVDCQEARELMADAPMSDFFFRYGRHQRLFHRVQLKRSLGLSYDIGTLPSREYDRRADLAIEQLFNLAERRMLRYLRKCGVCEEWYLAMRSDQLVCKKACRQKKHYADPEHNQHRRENYHQKKKIEELKQGKRKHA